MQDRVNGAPTPHKRLPWNKGKLTGAKPPLRPKHGRNSRSKAAECTENSNPDVVMVKPAEDGL